MSLTSTSPRLLRMKRVCDLTGISKSHVYHMVSKGQFPKPVSLVPGGSSKGWVEEEVVDWIESRIKQRNEGAEQ